MVARREGKTRHLAPGAHKRVVILVGAVRHLGIHDIGKFKKPRLKTGGQRALLLFKRRHRRLDLVDLGDQIIGVLALPLAHADFLGGDIAAGLHVLDLALKCAPSRIHLQNIGRHRVQAAAGHGGIECLGMFADKADVMHRSVSSHRSCGLAACQSADPS